MANPILFSDVITVTVCLPIPQLVDPNIRMSMIPAPSYRHLS
jgi:hypothetical protein